MTTKALSNYLLLTLFLLSGSLLQAQDDSGYSIQATPKFGWEVGLHGGHVFSSGDVAWNPGYGGGIHVRRALDYVFSVRLNGSYMVANGDSDGSGTSYEFPAPTLRSEYTHQTTMITGSVQGVMVLNNLRWDKPKRKVNLYVLAGGGVNYIQTQLTANNGGTVLDDVDVVGRSSSPYAPMVDAGAGIAFRISPGFNIALEHTGATLFGKRTDLIDGADNGRWRDIINYTSLRLNFNLRKGGELSEPLYWVNPLDVVLNDISELKARPVLDLTDTDEDGVIDILDQDKESPAGAPVDTRGVPLDSDDDGIPDYMDQEPYSPPGIAVDGDGKAQLPPDQKAVTQQDVERMVQEALRGGVNGEGGGTLVEWFLPMIHFNIDSYKVRYADYGNLSNIAKVLQSNPGVKLVVVGYTDQTASPDYNRMLSYNRAKAAVDHLVNNYGVNRDRLVLQYGGEENTLVPTKGSSLMNRRVEFRVARADDQEMGAPNGDSGKGDFQGNKDASGY
jgi:OOP family OmpA-OmpF porin